MVIKGKNDFIIICESQPWIENINEIRNYYVNIKNKVNLTKKNKKELNIVYPIFLSMSDLTDDEYWKTILKSAAAGKFPCDITFKNKNTLVYKNKSKITNLKIDFLDIEKSYKEIIDFFKNVCNIFSRSDTLTKKKHVKIRLDENICENKISWSSLKLINKESLINKYVKKLEIKWSLTCEQKEKLINILEVGILANSFNTNNIILINGEIDNIKNLVYENYKFKIDHNCVSIKKNKKNNTDKNENEVNTIMSCTTKNVENFINTEKKINVSFIEKWDKFLTGKNKRFKKYKL